MSFLVRFLKPTGRVKELSKVYELVATHSLNTPPEAGSLVQINNERPRAVVTVAWTIAGPGLEVSVYLGEPLQPLPPEESPRYAAPAESTRM